MDITAKRLSSGYYLIRGQGPCNYSQVPVWPPSVQELLDGCHPEAGQEFYKAAVRFVLDFSDRAPGEEI